MKLSLNILAILGVQLGLGLTPAHADAEMCANWQASDWNEYIESTLLGDLKSLDPSQIFEEIITVQSMCKTSFDKIKESNCTERIQGYYRHFSTSANSRTFTPLMEDQDYYAGQPLDRMALPTEFAKAPSGLPKNWKQIAKDKAWPWMFFRSRTGKHGSNRLIFIIKHPEYTQLILYPARDLNSMAPSTYGQVQMQTIEHFRDGRALLKPLIHFRTWRSRRLLAKPTAPSEPMAINEFGLRLAAFGGRCINCHVNGPRKVFPEIVSNFPTQFSEGMTLETINEAIVVNKVFDTSQYYVDQFFPSQLKVDSGKSTKCSQCHNGIHRSSLAFNLDDEGKFDLGNSIRKLITESSMPPNPPIPLSRDTRIAMLDDLKSSYYINLKHWLTEIQCTDTKSTYFWD